MSEKVDSDVESPKMHEPLFSNDPFSSPRSYANAASDWSAARPVTSKPTKNLVVRAWRAVGRWIMNLGRAVFSKEFWRDLIVKAFRDAFAGLGYSVGMRMVKSALGMGDISFHDKQGIVTTNGSRPSDAGQAFTQQSSTREYPRSTRSYGFVQDDIMAQPASSQPYTPRKFTN